MENIRITAHYDVNGKPFEEILKEVLKLTLTNTTEDDEP